MNERKMTGLGRDEALKRLSEFGPNLIAAPQKISFFGIARHEVTEPMILLLMVVGFFYSIWGNVIDALTIFAIISLLVLAEVFNEFRAKKAIASLEKIAAPRARVVRDGLVVESPTEEIVPGDIVVLSVGTNVPADARVVSTTGLQIDESALTGESFPLDKNVGDAIYAGTVVLAGEGEGEVLATGKRTRLGTIAATLKEVKRPRTPLQLAMKELAKKLVFVAVFFSCAIPAIGIVRGQDFRVMVLTGLSLSFATIPEELPIIITMVLGLGAYALSRNNFLVKRLRAAETLGNATVIVTDKTGTITEGKIKIVAFHPAGNGQEIMKSAAGCLSEFVLSPLEAEIERKAVEMNIGTGMSAPVRQRGLGQEGRKTKAVIRKEGDAYWLFLSGAPEEVFSCCRTVADDVKAALDAEAARGRRVIAVAHRKLAAGQQEAAFSGIEKDMDLAGLVVFEDRPRKGVRETIALAGGAGIRTIMVTGDHAKTAAHIAREIGVAADGVYTGSDLDRLADEDLRKTVRENSVFARTTPEHKYRIVRALQANGEVVAVTGDGINDILALKGADIGIAMGVRGTDVAKEAAEVILADDNYITIAQGIFEGRKFFDNLRKGIKYYLSVKAALIMIFLLPVLAGVTMPFSPIQIVLLELFMDLAASAGFVAEPREKDILRRPPGRRDEDVLSGPVIRDILINAAVLFTAVMAAYFYALRSGFGTSWTQTFAFSAWIFGHVILAFISRSDREGVASLGLFSNRIIALWAVAAVSFLLMGMYVPFLGGRFGLAPVPPFQVMLVGASTLLIVGSLEVRKYFRRS